MAYEKGVMIMLYMHIQQEATGHRIMELMEKNGLKVKDIQHIMGFDNPQAVYKWIRGKSLPSIDNLLILSKVLHTSIEDIIVYSSGDFGTYKDAIPHR